MSDNKKYYYLKLKDNFFDSEELIILQNMQDGYLYSDILFKMYLRSLKNEGRLMFNSLIPYTSDILAQILRHQVGVVEKAVSILQKLGLIEVMEDGAIYMMHIQNFIGHSSSEADRQREYQAQIKSRKVSALVECKESNIESNMIPTPEKEKEKEKEKELDTQKTFDKLWIMYNKKVGKDKAYKAFKKVNKSEYDKILEHIPRYVESTPEVAYRKHFATYLNQKSWNDDIIVKNEAKGFYETEEEKAKKAFDRWKNKREGGIE